ncbi:MAG: GNAT family N-acetyltransferase [Methylacidiphilales bacterium]|nr:GNAT family N-acetyltransferase [Candidatus Methylacidiphilales bacterium]
MNHAFDVTVASEKDLTKIIPMFCNYRLFYQKPISPSEAQTYLAMRMNKKESVILIASTPLTSLGFIQLYPTFCSLLTRPIYVLYDLYVEKDYRRSGVAKAMMQFAEEVARANGMAQITLTTAHTNVNAQALYHSLGYVKDLEFATFTKLLD